MTLEIYLQYVKSMSEVNHSGKPQDSWEKFVDQTSLESTQITERSTDKESSKFIGNTSAINFSFRTK